MLFKAHYEYMFKKIIVLEVSKDKQIEHLNIRGDDVSSSKAINKDFSYKNNENVYVIENNSTPEELYKKIDSIID